MDGNGLNNQKTNLVITTGSNIGAGQRIKPHTSIYKGVCWDKRTQTWRVAIGKHGKTHNFGRYTSEVAAAKIYDKKAIELFGEFARINFE